jgi:curli biogenesis system outer membrane secretion channel CsgG
MNMRIKSFLPLIVLFSFSCASTRSVINENYNWHSLKHIGVIPSSKNPRSMEGIDSIFDKYLIKNGFSVIERDRLESILSEQKKTLEGLMTGKDRLDPGILGVDAIMVVQVLFFNPNKKDMANFLITDRTETPNFQKVIEKGPNGKPVQKIKENGVKVSYKNKFQNQVISEYSQISITARLLDVNNGEVIWASSEDGRGETPLKAVEEAASSMISSFHKDYQKSLKK